MKHIILNRIKEIEVGYDHGFSKEGIWKNIYLGLKLIGDVDFNDLSRT